MDRFAFLSAQPWLFPPPERSVPPRGEPGSSDVYLTVVVDGVPRRLPKHLALRPDLGGAPVDPPARGGVAHHPLNADPAVVFDGCASVHFSEREQYGYPPAGTPLRDECVSDEENRDCGHPEKRRDARERACPVVGAAAADAVHMAFAPHDEWPDQAQFACSIRVRRAVVERDRAGDRPGNLPARGEASPSDRSISRDENDEPKNKNVFSAACWLEIIVDGATHALDMSQSRHVVVGPPAEWGHAGAVDSPEPRPEPHPSESSRFERGPGGRIVTEKTKNLRASPRRESRKRDENAREKKKRRRRGHDDPGNAGDDECSFSFSCGDGGDGDDDAGGVGDANPGGPGPVALRRRYEKPPFEFGFGFGSRPSSFTKSAATSDAPDESVFEDAPTPYVTIVFAHCSLNLYHHPGVLGCRRSSPAGERERVEKVRDALVAVRAAAFESAAAAVSYKPEETDDSDSGSIESGSSPPTELEHAAHVTASAASTLPRLAARAACEAVWAARERLAARTEKRRRDDSSLASAAAELAGDALEAFRSNDLASSLALLRAKTKSKNKRGHRNRTGDVRDTAQALLDDARVFAALARAAHPETLFM